MTNTSIKRKIDGLEYECCPEISGREDCEDRLTDGDVSAAELVACREDADSALISAMGRLWVILAAGGNADTDEQWQALGLPWCKRYSDAYRARAVEACR